MRDERLVCPTVAVLTVSGYRNTVSFPVCSILTSTTGPDSTPTTHTYRLTTHSISRLSPFPTVPDPNGIVLIVPLPPRLPLCPPALTPALSPRSVLSVGTRLDVLSDLLKEITQYMDDVSTCPILESLTNPLSVCRQRPQQQKSPEAEVELRLLIHTSHAGGIIGRGGQKIKELREETRCAIKVFSQCCPQSTERVCAVQGPVEVVIHAIRVVLDVIVATNIKGTVKLYDPFNFDAFAAAEYGGFGDPALVSPTGRPVPARGPTGSSQRLMDPTRPWDWNRVPAHRPGGYMMDRRDLQMAGAPPAASYPRWSAPGMSFLHRVSF